MTYRPIFICFDCIRRSIWGSSAVPVMRLARYPRADPKTAPPATARKYCSLPFGTVSFPAATAPSRMPKRTTAVPSLRRLSPSMIRDNRLSTVRSLKMASTEMGSVAEMMHPKRSAMSTDSQIPNTGSHHSVICGRTGVGELHTLQPSADSHTAACCTIVASPSC